MSRAWRRWHSFRPSVYFAVKHEPGAVVGGDRWLFRSGTPPLRVDALPSGTIDAAPAGDIPALGGRGDLQAPATTPADGRARKTSLPKPQEAFRRGARRPSCSTSISLRSARSLTTCCHSDRGKAARLKTVHQLLAQHQCHERAEEMPRMATSVRRKIGRVASSVVAARKFAR